MKKLFKIVVVVLAVVLRIQAQSNYQKGYIVLVNDDTLRGFINFKETMYSPKSIEFKSAENEKAITYNPGEIKYAEIEDEDKFLSYIGKISMDKITFPNLSRGIDNTFRSDTVFLKILLEGKYVNLYDYTDKIKGRYFILDKENLQPEELLFKTYYNLNDLKEVVRKDVYKAQLTLLAMKYNTNTETYKAKMLRAGYNSDLEWHINKVNGINEDSVETIKDRKNSKEKKDRKDSKSFVRFLVGVGSYYNTMKFGGHHAVFIQPGVNDFHSLSVQFNAGIDLIAKPHIGRLFFRTEISYSQSNGAIVNPSYHSGYNSIGEQRNTISFNSLTFGFSGNYNIYNKPNFKLNVGIGIAMKSFVFMENKLVYTAKEGSQPDYIRYGFLPLRSFSTPDLLFRAGAIIYKRLDITVAYYLPVELYESSIYRVDLNMGPQFKIGYLLQRKY